jgi:hypothetical protein
MRFLAHFCFQAEPFRAARCKEDHGDSMRNVYFPLSILIFASLVVGCAVSADAGSNEIQAGIQTTPTVPARLPATLPPVASPAQEIVPHDPPADCPITARQDPPFEPPAPYDSMGYEGEFWYGTDALWTALRENGIWEALPHNPGGYTQKVFWWRDGYVWSEEQEPELSVTAERLDASAPPVGASRATNAYAADIGSAMLVGVDFPTLGCWKVTGNYGDTSLSFVVWIAP